MLGNHSEFKVTPVKILSYEGNAEIEQICFLPDEKPVVEQREPADPASESRTARRHSQGGLPAEQTREEQGQVSHAD